MNRTLLTEQHKAKFMTVVREGVVSHQCVKSWEVKRVLQSSSECLS